jgi:hypothetical protein
MGVSVGVGRDVENVGDLDPGSGVDVDMDLMLGLRHGGV